MRYQRASELAYQLVAELRIDEVMRHSEQPVTFELNCFDLPVEALRKAVDYLNRTQSYYIFDLEQHLQGLKFQYQLVVTEYGHYGHLYTNHKK